MAKILLMGRRKPAVDIARSLGLEPVVLDVPARPLQAVGAYGGASEQAVAAALEALDGDRPVAVVAVAEGAVAAAARVRAHFGLAGLTPAVADRCHDKQLMKDAIVAASVPAAKAVRVGAGSTAGALVEELGLPVVVKEPISSGGRGVQVAHTESELVTMVRPNVLAEEFLDGVEMSVETFLVAGRPVFRNHTRYLVPRWANVVPAGLSAERARAVDALVDRAHAALGVDHGISHVELFLTEDGPRFGEIAARPPGGRLMELLRLAYGFDPWDALLRIELGEEVELPREAKACAGVWLLHPGPGEVAAVHGLEEARAMAGVHHVRCRVAVGDRVEARLGSGQSVGEVMVVAEDPQACEPALRAAHDAIEIRMAPEPGATR